METENLNNQNTTEENIVSAEEAKAETKKDRQG
jgi:hypothetical protein